MNEIINLGNGAMVKVVMLKGEKGDKGDRGDGSDYNQMTNKPSIDNVELVGNISSENLGLASVGALNTTNANVTNLQSTQASIAIIETSSTSAHEYTVGSYLLYNGILYEVVSAIAVGDTLDDTEGTGNISEAKISYELLDLKELISTKQNNLSKGNTTGNIDNLKDSGIYWVTKSNASGTMPFAEAYFILVVFSTGFGGSAIQLAIPFSNYTGANLMYNKMYYRMYTNSRWYTWFSITDTDYIYDRVSSMISDIGEYKEGDETPSFTGSIAKSTFVPVGDITLDNNDNGTWIFEGVVDIGSNSNGYRGLTIASVTPTSPLVRVAPVSGSATRVEVTRIIKVTGITTTRTYSLYAYQNSGSDLTGSLVEFRATRIK